MFYDLSSALTITNQKVNFHYHQVLLSLHCLMKLDIVSRVHEIISPLVYCWEKTDAAYYAETFSLLLPREYVFTCSWNMYGWLQL